MATHIPRELLEQMLRDTRLSDVERNSRFAQALDPGYWRRLAPGAHVETASAAAPAGAGFEPAVLSRAIDDMRRDSICHLPAAFTTAELETVNGLISTVASAGWPRAFAFVYDELWLCARRPGITALARAILGPDCRQIPHVWVHAVTPKAGATGWPPHVDGSTPTGRLTVWVALSEASLDNGCMYAVRTSPAEIDLYRAFSRDALTSKQAETLLHQTRALPAAAGEILAWSFQVIHWGGAVQREVAVPRQAISLEFISADEPPREHEVPLVALDSPLPPLIERLRSITAGVIGYLSIEPRLNAYEELAQQILTHASSQ
jgi:hypothetical protein